MLEISCIMCFLPMQVQLRTDDMDLAGDLIQALSVFLNIEDLQVTADFPDEMEILKDILVKVQSCHDIPTK